MLPIKKLYIDSRMRTKDSKSSADFAVDLPNTLLMPENTVFYVDDVTIPVSWYNINSHNNQLYVKLIIHTLYYDGEYFARITIPPGNYTPTSLGQKIATQIDDHLDILGAPALTMTSSVDPVTNKITIQTTQGSLAMISLLILSDEQVALENISYIGSKAYNSINTVLSNYGTSRYVDYKWTSGFVNLYTIRNIYLRSANLGTYSTLTLRGERDVIKKIPVSAGANEVVFNSIMVAQDYLDCSRQTLSRLEFSLEDVEGNTIDLNGVDWSFSLIFAKFDSEF